jgi:hypothetical protein
MGILSREKQAADSSQSPGSNLFLPEKSFGNKVAKGYCNCPALQAAGGILVSRAPILQHEFCVGFKSKRKRGDERKSKTF